MRILDNPGPESFKFTGSDTVEHGGIDSEPLGPEWIVEPLILARCVFLTLIKILQRINI